MPINPAYQFMNADASLDDKNQFLDFLRRDAMQKGMGANYIGDIGYNQEMMNVLGDQRPATQPMPQAPRQAPVNRPATRPVAPVAQPEQNTVPEFGIPPEPPGLMAPASQMREEDLPPEAPQAQPSLPQGFEQTTLAKKANEMGFDPRQLMVALAEFSAGMGNIKGKPTASTARSFYEMQKKYEDAQAGRDQEMTLAAMRMRQPEVKPVDPLTEQYKQTQIDYLKSKMQPKPAPTGVPTDPLRQQLLQEQIALTKARRGALESTQGMPAAVGGENVESQKPGGAYGEKIQVPGWRKTQNVPVEKTELKQFRDRSSKVPRVIEKINQLKGMIQKYGAFENPYNEAGTMMRQLSNDIKLDLKGPEFKALGVLAGPDMSILEALIPDTSSPKNALRGDASVTRSLDMLTQNLQKDLDAAALQLGFEKDAEQITQPTTTGTRGLPVWKP